MSSREIVQPHDWVANLRPVAEFKSKVFSSTPTHIGNPISFSSSTPTVACAISRMWPPSRNVCVPTKSFGLPECQCRHISCRCGSYCRNSMDRLFLMCLLDALKAKQPTGNACKKSRETCVCKYDFVSSFWPLRTLLACNYQALTKT